MHEMSLCEGVLQVLEREALRQHFTKVKTVWLEIGTLASVEPQAMQFCFEAVTRQTLADGAKLEIVHKPAQAWCLNCSKSVVISQRHEACPHCASYQLQITSGDELRIKELEVE